MDDAPTLDHADVERIRALLKDPVAVHLNMLHGHIAKIEMGMLAHVHGQAMQDRWAAFERWEAAQSTPSPPVAAPPATPVAQNDWQWVPKVSTAAMQWAFDRADVRFDDGTGRTHPMDPASEFKARYAALLAAAAQPQPATPVAPPNLGAAPQNGWDAWTYAAQPLTEDIRGMLTDVLSALEDGVDALSAVRADFREAYKGHYPERHARMEADVVEAEAARARLAAYLGHT